MLLPYNGVMPSVDTKKVYIAQNAVVLGNVTIDTGASVWFNTVVRGDMEYIKVGSNTNIQDNCTVHTDYNYPVIIGNNVTIGHNAVIHGCSIESNVLIGMGAIILNGATVKEYSVVAAGGVVLEGQSVGPNHLVVGAPAVYKRDLPSNTINSILDKGIQDYLYLSRKHRKSYDIGN